MPVLVLLVACGPAKSKFERDLDQCKAEMTVYIDDMLPRIAKGDLSYRNGVSMTDAPMCYALSNDKSLTRDEKVQLIEWIDKEMPKLFEQRIEAYQKERFKQ